MRIAPLPKTLPEVEGAGLADMSVTAYYRAGSWGAFHDLALAAALYPGFRRYFDPKTGDLAHFAWDQDGIRVCVWAPLEGAARV